MTPTREQVIEWARCADVQCVLSDEDDGKQVYEAYLTDLEAFAALAYSAGRLKGLDEAKEAVDALHAKVADPIFGQERHDVGHAVIDNCAAAIDQLKEQTP